MTILEVPCPAPASVLVSVPAEPQPPSSWEYSLQVPHESVGPGVARATVVTILTQHGLGALADTAELLASELATNAYRYSLDPMSVRVKWTAPTLRVSVWDSNPCLPGRTVPGSAPAAAVPDPDPDGEGGRGLWLVQACADAWGRYPLGRGRPGLGGKVVWFELVL